MGQVKLSNGDIIEDRRTNGARIKLDFADWWRIGALVLTVFIFGFNLKWNSEAQGKTLVEHDTQININTGKILKIETKIDNIESNVAYIRNKVDDMAKRIR
jgi:hypothetical protein